MSYRYMYQEALIEGEALGEARGEAKEKTAIAKSMLATGSVTTDFIAQVTKLSLADVQKLQAEMTTH